MTTRKAKTYRVTNGRGIAEGIPIFHLLDRPYLEGALVREGDLKPAQIQWLATQGLLVEVKDGG